MKTLKCEICGTDIQGEDFDAWFKAAYAHWTAIHADMMKAMESKPNAKEEQAKWMADKKAEFESAQNN